MARGKRAAQTSQEPAGEVVAVVREWQPQHDESLSRIHATIDSWGAADASPGAAGAPARDYREIEAAVDRITKRVKTRKVTVHETVTEYVEVKEPAPAAEDAWTPPAGTAAGAEEPAAPTEPAQRSGKRRPRILGWLGPKSQKRRVDAALEERAGEGKAGDAGYQPQCMALTEDGAQCLNSARGDSKYCASHKGYQPPTAKGIAQRVEGEAWDPADKVTDQATVRGARTKPKVRKARDTPLAVRKGPRKAGSRKGGSKKR